MDLGLIVFKLRRAKQGDGAGAGAGAGCGGGGGILQPVDIGTTHFRQ